MLWPHQVKTLEFLRQSPIVFDCSDPGTGKTRAHLAAAVERDGRVLVVCPKTLMRSAWGAELTNNFPGAPYAIAEAGQRGSAFATGAKFVIINTDGVKEIVKTPALLKGFRTLIVDESSAFKHPTAQRTKALMKLAPLFAHRALLSGTPHSNSVTELWAQMYALDKGARLGPSFFVFRNAVQVSEQVGPSAAHVRWRDKPQAEAVVYSLLKDVLIRHAFEDVMSHVPPNHRSKYLYTPNAVVRKRYETLAQECILALSSGEVTAVHAAALRNKLLQVLSGAVYTGADKYAVLDMQRYELVEELVDQYRHSLVFFNWRHQKDVLCDRFDARGMSFAVIDGSTPERERNEIVQAYQEGKYKTLLLHPRTGAHGLTLTRGEAAIVVSPFYEADLLKQAIHRIYRGSQDKATNTVLIEAENTVEQLVYARLNNKTERMDDFLEMVEEACKS